MKIKSLYELLIAERETSGLHTSSGGGGQKGFHRYYGFRNYYLLIESGQSIFKIRSDNLGLGWGNLDKNTKCNFTSEMCSGSLWKCFRTCCYFSNPGKVLDIVHHQKFTKIE